MAYQRFSSHAPTGAASNAKSVVSANQYAPNGRVINYPDKFDLYVTKQSAVDGSFLVTQDHVPSDMVGSRLYLEHHPIVDTNGNSQVSATAGTISVVNAKEGWIQFSTSPTVAFSVTYTASADCFHQWEVNNLQDTLHEVQGVLGPSNQTGWPGLRNLSYATFDKPNDQLSGVAPNAVALPHLNKNIKIGSTDDNNLTGNLGNSHLIQLGYQKDNVLVDATSFILRNSAGAATDKITIRLGDKTGDLVTWSGRLSGEGPVTIGGSQWPNYSGVGGGFDVSMHGTNQAMLRVLGDIVFMGDLSGVGSITVINSTGETSKVIGDFSITNKLEVFGSSILRGPVTTNEITVQKDIRLNQDLIALNKGGRGDNGHSLIDNLDCSEVAHTYRAVIQRVLPNSVISAPFPTTKTDPQRTIWIDGKRLSGEQTCGDVFMFTGFMNAAPGPSGIHPAIFQLNFSDDPISIVTGNFTGIGSHSGFWCLPMMDPGSTWLKITAGNANGFKAPIYHSMVEGVNPAGTHLTRLNVFCPKLPNNQVNANDAFVLYNPYAVPYSYISAVGGSSPTFTVAASAAEPLRVAFEDHVRILSTTSPAYSLKAVLDASVSGMTGEAGVLGSAGRTGLAYILANSNVGDIEDQLSFLARPIPFAMPGETCIGEVVATEDGGSAWKIQQVASYQPGSHYDSNWMPINERANVAGRMIGGLDPNASSEAYKIVYFQHNLGSNLDFAKGSYELFLAATGSFDPLRLNNNRTRPFYHSLWGADSRHFPEKKGAFTKVPFGNPNGSDDREASIIYVDGRVLGIQLSTELLNLTTSGQSTLNLLRLVMKRDR